MHEVNITDYLSMGSYAFNNCILLETVYIPDSVRRIAGASFSECENVELLFSMITQPKEWADDWNIHNQPVIWNAFCFFR